MKRVQRIFRSRTNKRKWFASSRTSQGKNFRPLATLHVQRLHMCLHLIDVS